MKGLSDRKNTFVIINECAIIIFTCRPYVPEKQAYSRLLNCVFTSAFVDFNGIAVKGLKRSW